MKKNTKIFNTEVIERLALSDNFRHLTSKEMVHRSS